MLTAVRYSTQSSFAIETSRYFMQLLHTNGFNMQDLAGRIELGSSRAFLMKAKKGAQDLEEGD
jgi:hypothetical protein